MQVITLTSDWGLRDHYNAVIKGTLMRTVPQVPVVDITHAISPFDIISASFVVKNSFYTFPEGSIHIISVITEASLETPHIVAKYKGHYFIGTDNGVFSLIFDEPAEKIIELDIFQDSDYFTFPTRDIFVKVAAHIIEKGEIESLGNERQALTEKKFIVPVPVNNVIKGIVLYVDRFENVITNISETLFRSHTRGKKFSINFKSSGYEITRISPSYNDVEASEKLALFSTTGLLEIAINQGRAASLLGLRPGDNINVFIEEEANQEDSGGFL